MAEPNLFTCPHCRASRHIDISVGSQTDVQWNCGSQQFGEVVVQSVACKQNVLAKEVERPQTEVNELNTLLRGAGWGQGEIDSSVTFAEDYERLRNQLKTERAERKAVIDDALVAKVERLRKVIQFALGKCVSRNAGNQTNPFAYLWKSDWDEFVAMAAGAAEVSDGGAIA